MFGFVTDWVLGPYTAENKMGMTCFWVVLRYKVWRVISEDSSCVLGRYNYAGDGTNSVGLLGESAFAMVLDGRRVVGRLAFSLGDKGAAICLRGRMKCFRNGA